MFTDIAGSTRLLRELGQDRYAGALLTHRQILREAFARHGGTEVDTQGDAFFVAFDTAPGAVAAAAEATDELASGPVRVRIGLHTGTPLLTSEGYVGQDVHRAARIAAAGHGGQILVSESTATLLEHDALRDLGRHRFKDLAAPECIYQLGEAEFPPLKSLYRTNMPVPATPFVGREKELSEVVQLLVSDDVRLLTLTGPGGTGKTRLALQAAAEAAQEFPDGIWWVPLAPLRDATLILSTVAQTLGFKKQLAASLEEKISTELRGKRALVLLDNCEHLMPDVAAAVEVLRDVPGPTVTATSRERLRIQGERAWPVPPLTPADGALLFTSRATSVDPSFVPTPAVEELCARLDELPLAVELAAARTALFSPAQLLERIGQRLDLLVGERDADPRQRTLRATLEWSHDLLTPEEQDLLRRLSVFAGGCTYEAAEDVCGAQPDVLQSLLDKSLLRRLQADSPRYWMLESVRQFARERLVASGEADAAQRSHSAWYASLAARMARPVRNDEPGARATVTADLSNMRAALALSLAAGDAVVAGDCIFGLWYYWLTEGLGPEAAASAEQWLGLDRAALPEIDRLPGLVGCAEIVRYTGDLGRAAVLKFEELDIVRAHADESVEGWELRAGIAATLSDLAHIQLGLGEPAEARALADQALSVRREIGAVRGIGHALLAVGTVALVEGDLEHARTSFAEAANMLSRPDDIGARLSLAESQLRLGEMDAAADGLRAILGEVRTARDVHLAAEATRVAGMLAVERGDGPTAARLLSAFVHLLEQAGIPTTHDANGHRARTVLDRRLRSSLDREVFDWEWARGAGMTEAEALDLAGRVAGLDTPQ